MGYDFFLVLNKLTLTEVHKKEQGFSHFMFFVQLNDCVAVRFHN